MARRRNLHGSISISTEVDVDIDEVLDELSIDDLLAEIEWRQTSAGHTEAMSPEHWRRLRCAIDAGDIAEAREVAAEIERDACAHAHATQAQETAEARRAEFRSLTRPEKHPFLARAAATKQ